MRSSSRACLALFALVVGCSARDERVSRSAQAVVGGADDTTDDAVAYVTTTETAPNAELCTGMLIAPQVVLTAGHCTRSQTASTLVVGFASSSQFLSGTVPVSSVVTYPGFEGASADVQGGLDLGLVLLAQAATAAPVPIAPGDASAFVGKSLRVVGYGYTDPASQDSSGTRKSAEVTIGGACSALLAFGDARSNACHGDSGGPLLATAADGSTSVVGVVSFGDDVRCASPSYAVRLDRFRAWLDPYVAGASPSGSCPTCPVAATDCAALEVGDAGGDAGPSRDASSDAGGENASASANGGCSCAGAGLDGANGRCALAVLAFGLALARRAQKRAVKLATPPPGRG